MEYQIWMEGYAATGEWGEAQMLAVFEADSFDSAVEKYLELHSDLREKYYRISSTTGKHLIWGCQLFDNEEEARKSFG